MFILKNKSLIIKPTSVCATYYSTSKSGDAIKSFSEVPGPKLYPFVGNLFELKAFGL